MSEDNKPAPITTTQFAKADHTVETGGSVANVNGVARDQSGDQTVSVKALRTFHKGEHMQGEMVKPGDTFDVSRGRAAELRANGLIEYANESDDKAIHGEAGAKKFAERQRLDTEARDTVSKNKTTPLRNPELKLAKVADEDGKDNKSK